MSKRSIREEKQCLHYLYRLVYPKFLQDFNQYVERNVAFIILDLLINRTRRLTMLGMILL